MILTYILTYLAYFIVFGLSILVHELGHVSYFNSIGKKVDFKWYYESWKRFGFKTGTPEDHQFLTRKQKYYVAASGILAGLLFLASFALFFDYHWFLLLIIPYLYGSANDIKNMIAVFKGQEI